MVSGEAARMLSAIGLVGRLEVFRLLVRAGPKGMASGEIAQRMGAQPTTMSANLAVLSQAGLIRSRRDSRSILYSVDFAAVQSLLVFLVEDCCGGGPEFCLDLASLGQRAAAET